jgi:hypothetical protein
MLEVNEWKLFNPKLPEHPALKWNRFMNWITIGRVANHMMNGRFPGGPPIGKNTMLSSAEWFRYAAHSVSIKPTANGLFQRALNGSLNAGIDLLRRQEYLGFNSNGEEIRYDYTYAFIDLEQILRYWPQYKKAEALQGIIIAETAKVGEIKSSVTGLTLGLKLIRDSKAFLSDNLSIKADEAISILESNINRK